MPGTDFETYHNCLVFFTMLDVGSEEVKVRNTPPSKSTDVLVTVFTRVARGNIDDTLIPKARNSMTFMTVNWAPESAVAVRALACPAPGFLIS